MQLSGSVSLGSVPSMAQRNSCLLIVAPDLLTGGLWIFLLKLGDILLFCGMCSHFELQPRHKCC